MDTFHSSSVDFPQLQKRNQIPFCLYAAGLIESVTFHLSHSPSLRGNNSIVCLLIEASREHQGCPILMDKYNNMFCMAQQPVVGQCLLIIEASRSHSDTVLSVGLLWTSDQPDADFYLTKHNAHKRHPDPPRDSNPQSQQANGRRPTPQTARSLGSAVQYTDEKVGKRAIRAPE